MPARTAKRDMTLVGALLLASAAQADPRPAPTPKPAPGSPEEIVCRREVTTGTLGAYRKFCATRAQWQVQSDTAQSQMQALDDRGRIAPGTH